MDKNSIECAKLAAQALFDKKGFNIIALDLRNVSPMMDAFVICEGSVERHVSALADEVKHQLKATCGHPVHIDGEGSGWMVLDYFHFMVHVFTPDMRQRYKIEQIWSASEVIPLELTSDASC